MKLPEQIRRLGLVVGVLVLAIVVVRFVVVPRSLVARDFHRASTVAREAAKPVKHAGSDTCVNCHEDVGIKKAKSYHRGLACETCHGPAVGHAEDPGSAKPPAPRDRKFCPVCHAYDPARPTGFPQINPVTHNPTVACITCHNPHDPVPPAVPAECAACHQQIAFTKAVSAHAKVECSVCHQVPQQHKILPRTARPTKPTTREVCGTCHSTTAARKDTPKVDLAGHGGRFLCWECHYPHLPEGRG